MSGGSRLNAKAMNIVNNNNFNSRNSFSTFSPSSPLSSSPLYSNMTNYKQQQQQNQQQQQQQTQQQQQVNGSSTSLNISSSSNLSLSVSSSVQDVSQMEAAHEITFLFDSSPKYERDVWLLSNLYEVFRLETRTDRTDKVFFLPIFFFFFFF